MKWPDKIQASCATLQCIILDVKYFEYEFIVVKERIPFLTTLKGIRMVKPAYSTLLV